MNVLNRIAVLTSCLLVSLANQAFAHSGGNHNPAPLEACSELSKAAACSYTNHHGDLYKGTCRVFSDALLCVRNEPIVKAVHSHSSEASTADNGSAQHSEMVAKP